MNITTVYQQHKNELIHYTARITSCRDTAEDIIQESFIIFSHKEKQQHIENPRAFLFCVAKNLAFDYLKHKKVTDRYVQILHHLLLESTIEVPSVEQTIANHENVALINQLLRSRNLVQHPTIPTQHLLQIIRRN